LSALPLWQLIMPKATKSPNTPERIIFFAFIIIEY
jgi:hypothetical protein